MLHPLAARALARTLVPETQPSPSPAETRQYHSVSFQGLLQARLPPSDLTPTCILLSRRRENAGRA